MIYINPKIWTDLLIQYQFKEHFPNGSIRHVSTPLHLPDSLYNNW